MNKLTTRKSRKANRIPILVVEENADQWLIMRSALVHCFPEVKPIWINTAAQTLTYLENCSADKSQLPQLLLVELYLPRRDDGLALLKEIKAHPVYRQVPVIVLSHTEEPSDIAQAYQVGIASYLVKPHTYHQWLVSFYAFRRTWWNWATIAFYPLQASG